MIVFIDTGVLGLLSSPNDKSEAQKCQQWLYSLLARGAYVISSDLCDYEVRRSLILNGIRPGLFHSQQPENKFSV